MTKDYREAFLIGDQEPWCFQGGLQAEFQVCIVYEAPNSTHATTLVGFLDLLCDEWRIKIVTMILTGMNSTNILMFSLITIFFAVFQSPNAKCIIYRLCSYAFCSRDSQRSTTFSQLLNFLWWQYLN